MKVAAKVPPTVIISERMLMNVSSPPPKKMAMKIRAVPENIPTIVVISTA